MRSKDGSRNSTVYRLLGILALCVASVAFSGKAASSTIVAGYRFTSFDVPSSTDTIGHHVNNMGTITGGYFDSNGNEHGYVRATDGSVIAFDPPLAAGLTDPEGINDAGDIVGFYLDGNGFAHGFLRDHKGTFTSIDVPFAGTGDTFAFAINNAGTIIGWYLDPNFNEQVFVRSPAGKFTAVNLSGNVFGANASSINEEGVIVGQFQDGNGVSHGFVRQAQGSIITFDAPLAGTGNGQGTFQPGFFPVAHHGLNERGDIAGEAVDSGNTAHGFLRMPDGDFVSFDVSGAGTGNDNGTFAGSINASGTIAGSYSDNNGVGHGFVRQPSGSIVPFDAPGSMMTFPFCISGPGEIVGTWADLNGNLHGFVMVPLGERR